MISQQTKNSMGIKLSLNLGSSDDKGIQQISLKDKSAPKIKPLELSKFSVLTYNVWFD